MCVCGSAFYSVIQGVPKVSSLILTRYIVRKVWSRKEINKRNSVNLLDSQAALNLFSEVKYSA